MSLVADRVSEKIADYGAVGAATSPWWLPSVFDISQWCAEWLPILGFAWLAIQMGFKVYDRFIAHRDKE